ncbi:MAG: hypothetical protein AB7O65_00450 [Candidatus Korobacteraceae bacterium]
MAAGKEVRIQSSGQGSGTLYIAGPGGVLKQEVKLGAEVPIAPEIFEQAGRYTAILRVGDRSSAKQFWVTSGEPSQLTFLARPSRLPVSVAGGISGVAYVFDGYGNLRMEPTPVKFELALGNAPGVSRTVATKNGVAWTRADAGRSQGAAQFVASVGKATERRVVQLVASDPCDLRMQASRVRAGIEIRTTPVRDCSGNPVPDGTIVTFTAVTASGRSSVDARIKRGIATATLPLKESALVSVASGVVMGNEIRVGGVR